MLGMWLVLFINMPVNLSGGYKSLYITILIGYLVYTCLVAVVLSRNAYIFEPIVMVLILYYFIFFIRPCYDIIINGGIRSSSGTEIYQGGIKATVLVLIGTGCMLIGYYHSNRTGFLASSENITSTIMNRQTVLSFAIIIWGVSMLFSMVYFLGSGFSISYVLSAGMSGNTAEAIDTGSLAIFSVFKSCLITSGLYITLFSRSRILKFGTFFIGLMVFISMGGRALTLVYIMTPIVYYYCSHKKGVSIPVLVLAAVAGVLLCVVMEATRTGIRAGNGFELPELTVELIMSPFDHELTTYKAFYGLVNALPEKAPYCFGRGIFLYTIVMMVPRGLWPGKPTPPIYDVIRVSMDQIAVAGGAVYPNIGEFYAEFGVIGVIVLMFVFGRYLRHLDNLRVCGNARSHALILYAAEYTLLLQVTIRGYTPSNFYQVLLAAIPVLVISNIAGKNNGKDN